MTYKIDRNGFGGGSGATFGPDLDLAGLKMELKTVCPSSHPDPAAELRKCVRKARTKYQLNGAADAAVIGITTRGMLAQDSTEDLATPKLKYEEEVWRPTPGVDVVIGAAVAEANAARRTLWAQRVRSP